MPSATHFAFGKMLRGFGRFGAAGCLAGAVWGGRREMPCSVFRGANRPRRILPVGKMLRGDVRSVCLTRRFALRGRYGGRWWLLRSEFRGAGGRLQIHFHCLTGRAVRDAFLPAAKCYGGWCVWRGGVFCGLRAVFVIKQKLHAGGRRVLSGR